MKVKLAIVLVTVVAMPGLIGLAASAAETAKKTAENNAAGDAKEKAVKELQGDWRVIRTERDGHVMSDVPSDASVNIEGDEMKRLGPEGRAGKFKLDPGKTPAEINVTYTGGPDKGKTVAGIYSLKERRLTICIFEPSAAAAPRPKEFKTQPNDHLVLVVFERVADAAPPKEKAVKDLQGDWRPLRAERNGQRESNIPSTASIVVNGDRFELSGPHDVCKLKLDSSKTPAEIDITFMSGPDKGKTILGIYSLKEGRLTICLPPPSDPSAPRPNEFKTKPNDNLELLVLERVGTLAERKWLDKTEKHETTAKYVGLSADGVRLQKTDGKIVTVPLDKLSDIDREYVHVKRCLEEEDERRVGAKKQDATAEAELKKAAESLAAGQTDEAIAHYRTAHRDQAQRRGGAQRPRPSDGEKRPHGRGDRAFPDGIDD